MLALKLQRIGRRHQPSYRVVVAEKRSKLGGPPVEDLGSYSTQTKQVVLKKERILHWLSKGAKPTVTIHNLLVREGVVTTPKIALKMKAKAKEAPAAGGGGAPAAVATTVPEQKKG